VRAIARTIGALPMWMGDASGTLAAIGAASQRFNMSM